MVGPSIHIDSIYKEAAFSIFHYCQLHCFFSPIHYFMHKIMGVWCGETQSQVLSDTIDWIYDIYNRSKN